MEKFFIDSHLGINIWIDVEKGLVTRIYGPSEKSLLTGLEKRYKGKTISFMAVDYVTIMHPSWCLIKSNSLTRILDERTAVITRLQSTRDLYRSNRLFQKSAFNNEYDKQKAYEEIVEKYNLEITDIDSRFKKTAQSIKDEHGFDWEENRKFNIEMIEKRGY